MENNELNPPVNEIFTNVTRQADGSLLVETQANEDHEVALAAAISDTESEEDDDESVYVPVAQPLEGELVADYVNRVLSGAGVTDPDAWRRRLHENALDPARSREEQLFLVNRALSNYIALFEESTLLVRAGANDTSGRLAQWCEVLHNAVIPCILRNQQTS